MTYIQVVYFLWLFAVAYISNLTVKFDMLFSGLMNITVLGLLLETKNDHCIKEMPGDYCMDSGITLVWVNIQRQEMC